MQMNEHTGAGDVAIDTSSAVPNVGTTPQLAEYIRELTAELTRMANSANYRSLTYVLSIASLEAKKLTQRGGCQLPAR
jgi:hypothetical protein